MVNWQSLSKYLFNISLFTEVHNQIQKINPLPYFFILLQSLSNDEACLWSFKIKYVQIQWNKTEMSAKFQFFPILCETRNTATVNQQSAKFWRREKNVNFTLRQKSNLLNLKFFWRATFTQWVKLSLLKCWSQSSTL